MFNLNSLQNIFSNPKLPWTESFEKRMHRVVSGKQSGKKTVIYLYENADNSTFRYRGYNMCCVLNAGNEWAAAYFFSYELERVKSLLDYVDVTVIIRYRWDEAIDILTEECKNRGIITVFDVDDLVFDIKQLHVLINTVGADFKSAGMYDYWFSYFSRLSLTGSKCDACISTNDFIADKLKEFYGKPCFVIPNFLNKEQTGVSEKLISEKYVIKSEKPFLLGYFSGSPSHKNDFNMIAPEIAALMNEFSGINLKIVGYMDVPEELKELKKQDRVIRVPFRDFRELQKEIAEVDVNVVPLLDNVFTNCKSELKYFESGIVNTVTCASPTYTYRNAIENNKNGYLCRQGEWYSVIKELFEKGVNPQMLEKARIHSYSKYGPENQIERIEKVLKAILLRGKKADENI